MADGFVIPADLILALQRRVELLSDVANDGVGVAKDALYTEVMRRAKASPRWVGVADNLVSWDENDRYYIGVDNESFISEAFAAEYGTDEYPPDPIMRTMDEAARMAASRGTGHMTSRLGVGGLI